MPNPKTTSDSQWIESSVTPIVYTCIRINFEAGRQNVILTLMNYMDAYAKELAAGHEIKSAFGVVDELIDKCGFIVFHQGSSPSKRESLEQLTIADLVASLQINIFLSYLSAASANDHSSIDRAVQRIRWTKRTDIYECELPQYALKQLEWLYPRIEFERRSEGSRVSPDWYIGELIRQTAVENSKIAFETIVYSACSLFEKWISTATENGLLWVRASLVSREAEYWQKVEYSISKLKDRWTGLNSVRRIEGLSSYSEAAHDSPLVRVFAREEMLPFYDGLDVFIEKLIRSRPDASKLDLSPRRRGLREALEREVRRTRRPSGNPEQPTEDESDD
jgi:hypothetical protein